MVPGAGLEPAHHFWRWILNPLRLPISPPGHQGEVLVEREALYPRTPLNQGANQNNFMLSFGLVQQLSKRPQMPAFPEHTLFPRAGLARRLGAILYDFLVIIALLMFATIVALGLVAGLVSIELITLSAEQDHASVLEGNPLFMLYLVAVIFWFYAGFWVRGGQTIGMRSWRLKVQNSDGSCISWKQAAIRFVSAVFGLSNTGLLLSGQQKLAWQDKAANCEVIVLSVEANKLRNWKQL